MPRSSPATISLPPFEGTVRSLILANVAVFLADALLTWLFPNFAGFLLEHTMLEPLAVAHGQVWQLVTYCYLNLGLMGILAAMLTLWFCGSILQSVYGSRWLAELYFTSAIGGALVASLLAFTHIRHLEPSSIGMGAWAGLFGILIALAVRMGDTEFMLWFLIRIQAKYMVGIYLFIALAVFLKDDNPFGAVLVLTGALSGYLYLRFVPGRGLAYGVSEQYFTLRNAYYRAKRRRAARKFEVYMGKQGRQVRFDKEGRYLDPDEERKNPNDKRWMN